MTDGNLSDDAFYMIDPPYFAKGSSLYTNFYSSSDHATLSNAIVNLSKPWIITYDNCDEISALYEDFRQHDFGLYYSANNKRIGRELMIVSRDLIVSDQVLTLLNRQGDLKKVA